MKEKLNQLIEDYFQAKRNTLAAPDADTYEELRNTSYRLNSYYWELVIKIISNAVLNAGQHPVSFTDKEKLIINYGYISNKLAALSQLPVNKSNTKKFEIKNLTDWLIEQDNMFFKYSHKQDLQKEINDFKNKALQMKQAITELYDGRIRQINSLGLPSSGALIEAYKQLEESRMAMFVSTRIKKKRSLHKRETTILMRSEKEIPNKVSMINQIIKNDPARIILDKISQKIVQYRKELLGINEELKYMKDKYEKLEFYRLEIMPERKSKLIEKLLEIKEDMELCSRWANHPSYAVLLEDKTFNTGDDIIDSIHMIEEFDPELFVNKRVKLKGMPSIIITPGIGYGSYDYRSNTLVIPITSPSSTLEAVAFAAALYRRDVDREINREKLWKKFFDNKVWSKIKNKPRPSGIRNKMKSFVNAYMKWITYESKGHMILDAPIREFFEDNIAPPKNAPIIPKSVRAIPFEEIENKISIFENYNKLSPMQIFELGMLMFRRGNWSDALKLTTLALENNNELFEALWTLAIFHTEDKLSQELFKTTLRNKRLSDARGLFEKAGKIKGGWWMKKAQEHIRKIDEKIRFANEKNRI